MRKRLALTGFAFLLACSTQPASETAVERPNVVIILADDLGYGDLSAYGATRISTPHVDQLAREGRRFMDAHSPASVCSPSRYNLLTGQYAWRTWNKSGTVWAPDPMLIDPDRMTLADLFKSQGYNTAVVGKWHLGFGSPQTPGWDENVGIDYNREITPGPNDVGFDYAFVFPHTGQNPHFFIENRKLVGRDPNDPVRIENLRDEFRKPYLERPRNGTAQDVKVTGGAKTIYDNEQLAGIITRKATDYIRAQSADKPFFLYFAHRSPHTPLKPDPRFAGSSVIGPYGDMISELDWSVGEVMKALDEKGLARNTVLIVTSDNGAVADYFSAPVRAEINGHAVNGPLRGQKTDAYEGGHRVPFIVRWPGRVRAGSQSGSLVALTDMMATFADYFGVRLPADAGEDSYSFLSSLDDGATTRQAKRDALISDSFTGVMSIRQGPWKLIMAQHGGGVPTQSGVPHDASKPEGQLFNLADDLGETRNLYAERPEVVAQLRALLETYLALGRSAPMDRQAPAISMTADGETPPPLRADR